MISEKEITKRWNERIVANNWHNEGECGVFAYLEKYGRNISNEKIQALADYAREQGFEEFASTMEDARTDR